MASIHYRLTVPPDPSLETPTDPQTGPVAPRRWNEDPGWLAHILTLHKVIQAIAAKYTDDQALREDCYQEAMLALLGVFPGQIRGAEAYARGELSEKDWVGRVDRYCRNVIRNSVLSYLEGWNTGNLYVGRTRRVKDRDTGEVRKVHYPARFDSLDSLVEDHGLQVDEHRQISWERVSDDGLLGPTDY